MLQSQQRFTFGRKLGLLNATAHLGGAGVLGGLGLQPSTQRPQRYRHLVLPVTYRCQLVGLSGRRQAVTMQPAAPQQFADIDTGVILQQQAGRLHTGAGIEGEGEFPQRVGGKPGPQRRHGCGRIFAHDPKSSPLSR